MSERLLVPYDGSAPADAAVERAFDLAKTQGASVYVLAIAPHEAAPTSSLPISTRLTDDLMTFVRIGTQLGIDVDGSYLDQPTDVLLRAVIETHRIDRVVMIHSDTENASHNGRLLKALVEHCPVPVTILP